MVSLCDSPFSLDALAARIRSSSNFRFNWQFYRMASDAGDASRVRDALHAIIADPNLHQFLRDSFDDMYVAKFAIEMLHEHCRIEREDVALQDILASAAGDHLGAYSNELRDATALERKEIDDLFRAAGDYEAYELQHGEQPGCPKCRDYNNHLFTNWFFGVAWDWCLLAGWPRRRLLWLGCLTDTD